jgi:methionyl-tRNA synthetase
MVQFEDFAKLQLRVGKIVEVECHPNAEKLYLLKVDIGEKVIQLVAGIKQSYASQDLQGKLIVVVVNLEPKEIRGCRSEGMLLAAQSGERVSLVGPYEPVDPGSIIR